MLKALPINIARWKIVIAQVYELGKSELLDYLGFHRQRMAENMDDKTLPCSALLNIPRATPSRLYKWLGFSAVVH